MSREELAIKAELDPAIIEKGLTKYYHPVRPKIKKRILEACPWPRDKK